MEQTWANELQLLKPGQGYWVHATAEAALVLSAPRIPPEMEVPRFIADPAVRSRVTGTAAIVLAEGVILHDATVDYWPADDLGAVQVLATGVEADGGDTVATLDTTRLANGSYVVRVSGTDGAGTLRASGTMVTVEGEYKPGRVRFTVNDLTAPVVGLPIVIGRTYDSLECHEMGDLAIGNPRLEVDPDHNVTLTMPDGRRVTFYFSPQIIWGFGIPTCLPEAGVYGNLKAQACGLVVSSGGKWFCFPGEPYQQSVGGYVYTDPCGREFTMGIDGRLQSIKDLTC